MTHIRWFVILVLVLCLPACTANLDRAIVEANAFLYERYSERPLKDVTVLDTWDDFPDKRIRRTTMWLTADACVYNGDVFILKRACQHQKLMTGMLVHEGVHLIQLGRFARSYGHEFVADMVRLKLRQMEEEACDVQRDYLGLGRPKEAFR